MMDFDNVLDMASQNQGHGNVQKRYSLQAGPPKKDPRSKGVNPAAVQALLKKQQTDSKKKEIQMRKQKDVLLAKRVELKSDRKARAMASRTKDNFKGYNGVPMVELPKKRRSKQEMEEERSMNAEGFRNHSVDPEDEDNFEYGQTDSEPEPETEPEPLRPGKTTGVSGRSSSSSGGGSKSSSKTPKPAPPPMNFAELLKLAEKKQFEPVDLKPKVAKKDERLRTADEIRELEMERNAKRPDKNKDSKAERERDGKSQSSSSSIRTSTVEKEQKNCKPQKNSIEKHSLPSGSGKQSNRGHSSSKSSVSDRERERPKASHSDRDRSKTSMTSSSAATNGKVLSKTTSSQVSVKQGAPKTSSSHKSSTSSDLNYKKESSSSLQSRASGTMLPPITSAYKRKLEDEEDEYDSEMEDFIDDEGDEPEEISRHIKEIFGYDRNKYKEESDYALKFMESSWKDLQKEEARSLRLAVQEDLEEEKREEEELKRKTKRTKKD
ncbi:hypothetical protein F2P81_007234 [Scophthalmus maximus]|uniref:Protein SPT2 homolog n=1 Tax=Scophthalmus maximus TaxID=52904 RepID=A0A6A4T1M2_SCOMX|nr:hypothetical protein F2P81_007234 [Scophthalmus maximus]